MIHRHIINTDWSLMAIESLFDRGTPADWREFCDAMRQDPAVAERALRVGEYRERDGAELMAATLVAYCRPEMAERADAAFQAILLRPRPTYSHPRAGPADTEWWI